MKIVGIGNALVDLLAKLPDDSLLKELGIAPGSMNLIDDEQRMKIFSKIQDKEIELVMTTGGSVSNSTLALQKLGIPIGFIGKVGSDHYGKFYLEEMNNYGVNLHLSYEQMFSGTALCLITPDGERTFTTYLGAAASMRKSDLNKAVLEQYSLLYVEGYLIQNHELIENALSMAKSLGLKTALDLASYNVVEAEKDFLTELVEKYVDILFANEEEAIAFTGKKPEEALFVMSEKVDIAVVKEGSKGAWIKQGNAVIHVPCHKVINPVDTTAAGDYYAAGFLAGLSQGEDLETCAKMGTLLSYYIIQVVGTKLETPVWEEIHRKLDEIK